MYRRALRLWRRADATWPQFMRRPARTTERVEEESHIPAWDVAAATAWRRYAGHAARQAAGDPSRLLSRVLPWWRETLRAHRLHRRRTRRGVAWGALFEACTDDVGAR